MEAIIEGLKDIYYAVQNSDNSEGATYGTPKKLGHAINVELNPDVKDGTLHGDNMAIATKVKVSKIGITIETSNIPLEDRAIILGHHVDSVTGAVTVKGDDQAPYVAIMFEATAENSSQFYKFYKVKFAPSQQSFATEGEDINWQTPSMTGNCIARTYDKKVYDMVDSASEGSATLVSSWFTAV